MSSKPRSVLSFLFSTLLLVIALTILVLDNSWPGYFLSLLVSFISYGVYKNIRHAQDLRRLLHKRRSRLSLIFDVIMLSITALTFNVFRTASNIEFLFNQQGSLMLEDQSGNWQNIDAFTQKLNLTSEYQNEHLSIYSLPIRREARSVLQKAENLLNPNKVLIFEFSPNNKFLIYADIPDLRLVNAKKAMQDSKSSFVINSNFYGSNNKMLGELIVDGKRYGKPSRDATGFFRVIKGVPYVGAKSVLGDIPGPVQYSCQAMPSVIKNGEIFSYINSESGPYKSGWAKKTYRNLVGKKRNGNLVFMVSNNGALLSVKEISQLAKVYNIHNASLFDGGAALQYRFENGDYATAFSTFNNFLSLGQGLDDYVMNRFRMNFSQKSPVYICVKENKRENQE